MHSSRRGRLLGPTAVTAAGKAAREAHLRTCKRINVRRGSRAGNGRTLIPTAADKMARRLEAIAAVPIGARVSLVVLGEASLD